MFEGGDNMTEFQISLAAARTNANMTQSQLASNLGVHESTIKNWENGKTSPRSDQLKKISDLTGVPMDYIFLPDTLLNVENKERSPL